jgi:hypothetical protein
MAPSRRRHLRTHAKETCEHTRVQLHSKTQGATAEIPACHTRATALGSFKRLLAEPAAEAFSWPLLQKWHPATCSHMPEKPVNTPEFNCTQRHKGPPPRYQRTAQGRPLWVLSKDFWRSLYLRPCLGPASKSGTRPPAHTCRRNL